jgi:hypothetical protein
MYIIPFIFVATACYSATFFGFPLPIIIPPLLHTHLSLPPEVCDSPDQAAHYKTGVSSLNETGWLQSKEFVQFH